MNREDNRIYIIGGGMTGLAAGMSSGLPVLEAQSEPGGICSSYYIRPGQETRLTQAPDDEEAYRFEIGGGHWIFGGDPAVLEFINSLTPVKSYSRQSAVYFSDRDLYVPYPLQNHLRVLGADTAMQVLKELVRPSQPFETMEGWLEQSFGPTLCRLFFFPFHELYTAGLYREIAPQDSYKSPVKLPTVIQGAFDESPAVGYNVTFVYPKKGLNTLAQRMAARCDVRYGKRVVQIDTEAKQLTCEDGTTFAYDQLISTLPLNKAIKMADVTVDAKPDPYTSVLVLNIGAERGKQCPDEHWLYNPDTESGFHRVGFYSNVDRSFLPLAAREQNDRVSIYVERAFVGGNRPASDDVEQYCAAVVEELQDWGFIGDIDVVDPTWIEVAYTWSYPHSQWKQQALKTLEDQGIYQVGRYGRWIFQGIADSIRDGFVVGASFQLHEALASSYTTHAQAV